LALARGATRSYIPCARDALKVSCMKRRIKAALGIAALMVLALSAAMAAYIAPATLEEGAYAALVSDEAVRIDEEKDGVSLLPRSQADTGFIFYTGARVPPAAYAAILKPLAQRGIAVFIPQCPFNFAIFDIDRAGAIIADNPGIKRWYLGGHSLGGASAAIFATKISRRRRRPSLPRFLSVRAGRPVFLEGQGSVHSRRPGRARHAREVRGGRRLPAPRYGSYRAQGRQPRGLRALRAAEGRRQRYDAEGRAGAPHGRGPPCLYIGEVNKNGAP
jgi:hypothetical protein